MKKFTVLLLAAAMVIAFAMPAAAFENIFGGYWRTRAFLQRDFSGDDSEAQDVTAVDTRTRLYYTAKFSDDFQFINKFEINATWGDSNAGRIAADAVNVFRIKNSYVDFNTFNRALNWKIGIQGHRLGRGFLFDDDFSGAVVTYKGPNFELPFVWIKAFEGGTGADRNDFDIDMYTLNPSFTLGGFKINPFFTYVYSDDASDFNRGAGPQSPFSAAASGNPELGVLFSDINVWFAGANVDFKVQGFNVWGTAIYQGGDAEVAATGADLDFSAWLFGLGASGVMGPFGVHGEAFYATGDDDPADGDNDAFAALGAPGGWGQSYYWAEIMGQGIFDNQASANSPQDQISNIWAANLGADYKLFPSLNLGLNLWYAERVEETATPDEPLGFEVDLKATYQVMQNLNLDLVGAYLFAGDGTAPAGATNTEDPYLLGARLSLSF